MVIQNWSDEILVGELAEDPIFSEDLASLMDAVGETARDVVLNFGSVDFLNSSNIARLLRLRKAVTSNRHRLILCGINDQVWGIFLVTGLDKIFEYTNDTATALATLQLGKAGRT